MSKLLSMVIVIFFTFCLLTFFFFGIKFVNRKFQNWEMISDAQSRKSAAVLISQARIEMAKGVSEEKFIASGKDVIDVN